MPEQPEHPSAVLRRAGRVAQHVIPDQDIAEAVRRLLNNEADMAELIGAEPDALCLARTLLSRLDPGP